MKTTILVTLLALVVTAGVYFLKVKTKVDWNAMQRLDIYTDSSLGKDFEKMKDIDLNGKAHYTVDLEQAKKILRKAKTEMQIVTIWKDYRYAVAHPSEGKPLRLKISNNGFFTVLNFGRKYQLREEDIEKWNQLCFPN